MTESIFIIHQCVLTAEYEATDSIESDLSVSW